MRVLVCGDLHGDARHTQYLAVEARRRDIDLIIQLGDWGFKGFDRPGKPALVGLTRMLSHQGVKMWFLDGNHDDHDWLRELARTSNNEPVDVNDQIRYLPRGSTFDLDGVSCMALGGAYSIDKEWRIQHNAGWWPQEMISLRECHQAIDNGKAAEVKIMFTHDCPEGVCPIVGTMSFGYKADESSRSNRLAVSAVVEEVHPELLLHGHMHHRYTNMYGHTRIEGLACNPYLDPNRPLMKPEESWVILDTNAEGYL